MASTRLRRAAVCAAALATTGLFAGCGGSASETTVQQTASPAISIALSALALDVQAGATGSVTVTLTRSGGFAGDVTIAVNGLPAGVTASTTTIAAGQTSASVTLNATLSATLATTSVVFQASGGGVASVTASLAVTIHVQTAIPSFAMGISPTSLSVAAGASGTATITITRSSAFTGAVTLTVVGSVVGMTPTFSPATVTGSTATLTVAFAATVAPGSMTVTIRGSGTGVTDQTVALPVTITAASSGNITWRSCGSAGLAAWVAVQDGAGAWTRVVGVNDTYSFSLSSGRGGVAYVFSFSGADAHTNVAYGTATELQALNDSQCGGFAGRGKTVTAAIAGAGSTDKVQATLGRSLASVSIAQTATTIFSGVGNAPVDLVAVSSSFVTGIRDYAVKKVIIRRGLTPADGSALAPIDFGGAEAFDPVTNTVTVANVGSDSAHAISYYVTATNATLAAISAGAASPGDTRTYAGIPAAKQTAGDFHVLLVDSYHSVRDGSSRQVTAVFKDAADRTIALGPVLAAPTITAIGGGATGRVQAVIVPPAEYNSGFTLQLVQINGPGHAVDFTVFQTRAYAGESPLTLSIPDLMAVSGFDPNWGLQVGTVANWLVSASGGPIGTVFDGATWGSAVRIGTITP